MTSQLNYAPVYHNNSEWPTHIWAGRLSDGETRCYVEQRTCVAEENIDASYGDCMFVCSECGADLDNERFPNYCPQCGARITEEE